MKRIRTWLIPLALTIICALVLVWAWWIRDVQRQENMLLSMACVVITGGLILLWFLFLGPFRLRTRFALLGGVIAIGLLLGSLLDVGGVSGDLFPILVWRYAPPRDVTLTTPTAVDPQTVEPSSISSVDYPQFLGPDRNATLPATPLARDWEKQEPRLLWRQPIGAGWSGFAVAGDAAYTQEQRGESELVTCYSVETGALRWSHADQARFVKVIGGIGPRATPTVTADRVYSVGATGILNCLDRATGENIWGRNVVEENNASLRHWGTSGSPLVHGDLVIVSVGGKENRSMVAYRTTDGEPVWHGGTARNAYSSPSIATVAGVPQVLILNHKTVTAHDPANGQVLWEVKWEKGDQKVAQPVTISPDRVMVSAGYGVGAMLLQIERDGDALRAKPLWEKRSLKAKFANFVVRDGFVYGLDDSILVCVDVETGERRWKRGRYGHGQMILVGDLLLIMAESGDVALVELNPAEHRELTRFTALDGKTWNSPALATPYLLVRNDQEAACYELPLAAD